MKLLRIFIILIIGIGVIFGGLFLFKRQYPDRTIPFVDSLTRQTSNQSSQQTEDAKKLQSLLVPTPLPAAEKNSKFDITKTGMAGGSTLYIIHGQMLSDVVETNKFYSADFAIDGDTQKTPVKLVLTTLDSTYQFGTKNAKGDIEWKPEKAATVFSSLKLGQKLELRVLIDRTNQELVKNLEGPTDALFKATEIKKNSYTIQPQMIAIL